MLPLQMLSIYIYIRNIYIYQNCEFPICTVSLPECKMLVNDLFSSRKVEITLPKSEKPMWDVTYRFAIP